MGYNHLISKDYTGKARGQGVGGNDSFVVNKVTSPLAEITNKKASLQYPVDCDLYRNFVCTGIGACRNGSYCTRMGSSGTRLYPLNESDDLGYPK
jgi:hypothetical protein